MAKQEALRQLKILRGEIESEYAGRTEGLEERDAFLAALDFAVEAVERDDARPMLRNRHENWQDDTETPLERLP